MIRYEDMLDTIQKNYRIKNPLVYNSLVSSLMHINEGRVIYMALKHINITNIHRDITNINKRVFKSMANLDLALSFNKHALNDLTDAILETIIWKNNIVISYYWYYKTNDNNYISLIKDTLEMYIMECVSEMLLDYKLGYYNMDTFALVNDYTREIVNDIIKYSLESVDFYDFIDNLYLNLYFATNGMVRNSMLYTIPKRVMNINNNYILDYIIMLMEGG